MRNLLKKEFLLSMHPTVPMMLLLSAMVMIPSYPYVVIFFYVTMAIFFTCLSGRENHDIIYSLNLPVAKQSIVNARITFAVILEFAQLAIMIPFTVLHQRVDPAGNQAGMDANLSLFGVAFVVYGLFNFVFFGSYYKNVSKVGIAFVRSSIVMLLLTVADVVSTYAIPVVRDVLDTADPAHLPQKLIFCGLGLLFYAVLTALTYKISVSRFDRQDLTA